MRASEHWVAENRPSDSSHDKSREIRPASGRWNSRTKIAVVAVVAVVLLGSAVYLVARGPPKSAPGTPPGSIIALGAVQNDSAGASPVYVVPVFSANPSYLLANDSFIVKSIVNSFLDLASVCIANSSGVAEGTWVAGNWSVSGTSVSCGASATLPLSKNAALVAGDDLFFFLGPAVSVGVPVGTNFCIMIVSGAHTGPDCSDWA